MVGFEPMIHSLIVSTLKNVMENEYSSDGGNVLRVSYVKGN